MRVETEEEAVQVLLAKQKRDGGIPTLPATGDTVVTEAGWAFFNANGYLGTVTKDGKVEPSRSWSPSESVTRQVLE